MDEPLPDHFKALGVEKTADASAIKKAHRLLVLHCHPDKVTSTDPAVRQEKAELFHKIQKAYEVLIDETERAKYEASITLEALRREKLARGGATASREKATRFESRPSANTSSNRYATEERRPTAAYADDDKYYDDRDRERARASTRSKYETYSAYPPKTGSTPRTEKESSRTTKATADRTRSDRTKTRDKEDRRNHKFVSVESESSSADEKARYEAGYKRRSQEEEVRRQSADTRRKPDERRSYEDPRYETPSARKMSTQAEEAIRYLHKSREQVQAEMRPTMDRTTSRDYYEGSRSSRPKESRPEPVRRSSARPKERTTSGREREGRDRDRAFPEIVDWDGDESSSRRMPPPLKQHTSSPAKIEVPRATPERRYTEAPSRDKHASTSPPPAFHRSQTMPSTVPHASSRSKPASVPRPSGLRETMTPEHSSPEAYPSVPPPQPTSASKTKYYHYPTPNGSVPLRQDDLLAGSHRTVLREPPSSQRHRSPEAIPLGRPPIGANRPSEANISKTSMPPPPMGRSSSSPIREEQRGRSGRPLYGEMRSDSYASQQRPRPVRQSSFNPNEVQYAPKYGPEDVRWAPRGRENERSDYGPSKPTLGRTATYVY
ncbi:hypothetical protein HBI56_186080 [Parastagonospora nodorum]|uniref:J domain-containing protein n=2 Tax=Phaeosphaeria nodorum (strain SN15 / ATCC MYA-4574 / FGSC 10173) TaxID=321614 RepID=A0A7U2IB83_PHANO|nr:hypothetical protein SNOG_11869 [Parastagonospora nodorum SN15]KAH3909353.1 hypothetical protein HBH56_163490 [Parastagonospora nodorum]EAT80913.2 hypothetical protein SNOG_11869 [Parastagonospora nodorum SN15]KAH3931881.1 hypothetical protein HBH54_085740 [Parastagonospora nodorum]KAH3947488.1 hypothetical protein HBH53_113010 [Parastagonospora nodorum]KAH3972709.1 hypothetical protein HBH51_100280 [Parastagonospora nodorum]